MSFSRGLLAVAAVAIGGLVELSAASSYATGPFAGSQYIQYNGTISATIKNPSQCTKQEVKLGPYVNSYLYVGKNPPWDPNPFFFELYHLESESNYTLLTSDEVYNLDFPSAAYACGKDGGNCAGFVYADEYKGERKLDLTKANVGRVSKPASPQLGYAVNGDFHSYIGQDSDASRDEVDVDAPCSQIGVDWTGWSWNASTDFTYTLGFFNDTAYMTVVTYRSNVIMTIDFEGDRASGSKDIELDTSDKDMPQFKFFGNQTIYFANFSGNWTAASTPIDTSSSTPTSTSTSGLSGPTATSSGASTTSSAKTTGAAQHAFNAMDASNVSYMTAALLGLLALFFG